MVLSKCTLHPTKNARRFTVKHPVTQKSTGTGKEAQEDALFAGSVSYFNVGRTHAFDGTDGGSGTYPSLIVNANSEDLVVDTAVMSLLASGGSPVGLSVAWLIKG